MKRNTRMKWVNLHEQKTKEQEQISHSREIGTNSFKVNQSSSWQ